MSHQTSLACAGVFAAAAILAGVGPGFAHTIIGDRIFPATLAISDPGTNDELTLPTFAYTYNADGSQTYNWNFFYGKRITADLEVQISSAFLHQINPRLNGWTGITTAVVDQIMVSNEHEFVVSVGVAETWGASGTPGIADQFTTITPQLFIGKGFGDIPWDWARPIAVTGQINYNVPTVAAVYR